jgi:hypothetical protein
MNIMAMTMKRAAPLKKQRIVVLGVYVSRGFHHYTLQRALTFNALVCDECVFLFFVAVVWSWSL